MLPRSGRGRRLALCYGLPLGLAVCAVLARAAAGGFGDNFGGGHFGANGAAYTARFARVIDQHGFVRMRFAPAMFVLPTEPPTPAYYLNHPSLYFLSQAGLSHAFGWDPRIFQLAEALIFGLTPLVVAGFFGTARCHAAAAAGAIAATIPLASHFGFMVNSLGPCVLFAALAWLLFRRWRERRSRVAAALLVAVVLVACQLDWWSYMVFPAFAFDLIFRRSAPWRTPALTIFALALCSLVITFVHFAYVLGGFDAALGAFSELNAGASRVHRTLGIGDLHWWERIGQHIVRFATWPGVFLMASGLIVGTVRGQAPTLISLLAAGLFTTFLLPAHAFSHDFFLHPLVLFAAVSGAFALEPLLRSRVRLVPVAGWVIIAALALFWIVTASRAFIALRDTFPHRKVAEEIEQLAGEDDIVLTTLDTFVTGAYSDVVSFGSTHSPVVLDQWLHSLRPRRLRGRVLFLLPESERASPMGKHLLARHEPDVVGPVLRFVLRDSNPP